MKSPLKRVLLSIGATLGIALMIPASSFAVRPNPQFTEVTGTVTYNGAPVNGAKVTIVCDNNAKHFTTGSNGVYTVEYASAKCPIGATIYATATKGKKGGDADKRVTSSTDIVNIQTVNVSLPEFGLIAGTGAATIGVGAFLVIRRRQLSGHQG